MNVVSIFESKKARYLPATQANLMIARFMEQHIEGLALIQEYLEERQASFPCDEAGLVAIAVDALTHSAERIKAIGEYEACHQPFGSDPKWPA